MRSPPDPPPHTSNAGGGLTGPSSFSSSSFTSSVFHKALIRSDVWFPDGNIVLVAGSAAFKVHRGQLERHSEVFKDMFVVGRAVQGSLIHEKSSSSSRSAAAIVSFSSSPSAGEGASAVVVNEEGNRVVDGCPTVDVYDCPSDVYHLLVALYDGLYFPRPHARDFSALSSVLRLSTKYFIEHLRKQCLARLAHDWPTTLADWDRREAAAIDASGRYMPRDVYPHPVLAINLALELGIPEVLPSAFYDLSRYGPSRIVAGARQLPQVISVASDASACTPTPLEGWKWQSGTAGGRSTATTTTTTAQLPMIRLPHDHLLRTLRGRELAQLYISTFLTRALEHRPSSACLYSARSTPPSSSSVSSSHKAAHCTESFYFIHLNVLRSIGGIACGRDADPLYTLVQAAEMLERKDFSDGVRTCGLKMCGVCRREWKSEVGRAREEVWGLIPVWFGLRDGGATGSSAMEEMEMAALEDDEATDVDVEIDSVD